ncbi:MAG TPA: LuxR C-terminal-related transcriptional regulator [Polyangiaceae bacterium]|nr:LuxR C-terminal-related transcriptional regulator [Polyangiaceae bacterium]
MTVASVAAKCARVMGMAERVRHVPALVIIAAHAAANASTATARAHMISGSNIRVVSAERPTLAGSGVLSNAEAVVADLLIDRRSNAEIAQIRRKSPRTVANQVSSLQRKLGVSGRAEIVSHLIRVSLAV